jgi:dCMP deaminase
MVQAKVASLRSGCNSRPTGAVIVANNKIIATGYNGTLPGDQQCTDKGDTFCLRREIGRCDKGPKKYFDCPSIHAEQNALNQLAKGGGAHNQILTVYCTLAPCIFCLKNMLSVGVTRIIYELQYESDDPVRDAEWRQKGMKHGIEIKQLKLTKDEIDAVLNTILEKTSLRRL